MPPGFNLQDAIACARASLRAYPESTVVDVATDTQVLIVETDAAVIVAFRGSSSVRDWLTNIKVRRWLWIPDRGRVHRGFMEAFNAVKWEIGQCLNRYNRPILITGHSLGGALAMLFADWLNHFNFASVRAVYTFGQPRVGNAEFAAAYNKTLGERTFRFINGEDAVARTPSWLRGYRHAGTRLFFSVWGRLEVKPRISAMLISDVFGIAEAWLLRRELTLFGSHGMAEYVAELLAVQTESTEGVIS